MHTTRASAALATFLSLLAVVFTPAAASADAVAVVPKWQPGDVREIDVVRTAEERMNGSMTASGRVTSRLRLTVVEVSDEGSVVQWQFVDAGTPVKLKPAATAVTFDIDRAMEGLTIELRLDANGRPKGVRNLESLRVQMDGVIGAIAKAVPPEVRGSVKSKLQTDFADDAKLTELLLIEPSILLGPIGETLTVGEAKPFSSVIFTPLLGKGRGRGTRTLQVDEAADTATVASVAKADYSLKGKTRSVSADSEDRSEHVFERATGWPVKVRYRQLSRIGPSQRVAGLWYTVAAPAAQEGAPVTTDAE